MIQRPRYLEKLRRWKDRDVIKVVTGVRRCGKSTLLRMFSDELVASGVPRDCVIIINLEQMENDRLLDARALHDEIVARAQGKDTCYLFIDEVQNVPDFQRVVDSLYTRDNIDLYITGSNALLLGGRLATLLSGRYVEINMMPLSFSEYVSAFDAAESPSRLYSRYIANGAMPATLQFASNPIDLRDYLDGILNTILLKDVAQRLNASNTIGLGALCSFMFDNIGNLTTIKRISDVLTSQGTKISGNTVAEYLSAITDSFAFYPAKRYDVRGGRLLKLQEKYYAVDLGMRRVALSGRVRDTGRILENVVFLELRRRYGEVFVGRVGDLEIDFVANEPAGPVYFQVAESVRSEETLARELASLRAVRDNCPKTLITLDDADPCYHDGILQVNALDWLLEKPIG